MKMCPKWTHLEERKKMENEEKLQYFGMWSDLRIKYLQEEKPEDYKELEEEHMIIEYMQTFEDKYRDKFHEMVEQQMEKEGVTEELKIKDQMEWVGRVNNIRARVREILIEEICS